MVFRHPSGHSPFCLIFRPRNSETALGIQSAGKPSKMGFSTPSSRIRGVARQELPKSPTGKLRITIAYRARAIRRAARFRPVPSLFFSSLYSRPSFKKNNREKELKLPEPKGGHGTSLAICGRPFISPTDIEPSPRPRHDRDLPRLCQGLQQVVNRLLRKPHRRPKFALRDA